MSKAIIEEQKQNAIAELKEILKEGDEVYTLLRHVSSNGMSRRIDVYVFRDNQPRYLSWWVSKVVERKINDGHEGIVVRGAGMDMGFELIYSLSYRLCHEPIKLPSWYDRISVRRSYENANLQCRTNTQDPRASRQR